MCVDGICLKQDGRRTKEAHSNLGCSLGYKPSLEQPVTCSRFLAMLFPLPEKEGSHLMALQLPAIPSYATRYSHLQENTEG